MQEYAILIVFAELGSASSGNDVLVEDGTYRKQCTIFRDNPDPQQGYEYAKNEYPGREVMAVYVRGPYKI